MSPRGSIHVTVSASATLTHAGGNQDHEQARLPIANPPAPGIIATIVVAGFVLAIFSEATSARRPAPLPTAPAFLQRSNSICYNTKRWIKADRWTNGSPFDNAWRADHIAHDAAAR